MKAKVSGRSRLGTAVANNVSSPHAQLPAQVIELQPPVAARRIDTPASTQVKPLADLTKLAAAAVEADSAFIAVLDDNPLFGENRVAVGDAMDEYDTAHRAFCRKVVAAGSELIIEDARVRRAAGPDEDGFASAADGLVAWAGFPVRGADGRIAGVLCVADRRPRRWTEREIDLLRGFGRAAAREIALHTDLDSSRRLAAERESLARTLQESLLPPWLPQIPGMEVASRYVAGGAGVDVLGDFFDVFPSVRGSWGVVIGDVCGKGVPAAKSTALARYTLRAEAHRENRPSLILTALNRAMLNWPTDDPRFLSAVYATVRPTPAGASVQISSAGHPLALVHRADGRVHEIGRAGVLLGLFTAAELDLSDARGRLRAGDSLVLFTDGVTEARRPGTGELFGDDRLHAVLAEAGDLSAAHIADSVQQAVRAFGGTPASDDTAVLVLKVPRTEPVPAAAMAPPARLLFKVLHPSPPAGHLPVE